MEKKALRKGVTTGTCAAAAAKAAAVRLLSGVCSSLIKITLPNGATVVLEVEEMTASNQIESCFRIQKDAGDDPDVTNHTWVYSTVSLVRTTNRKWYRSEQYPYIYLTGGEGIGIVTKRGLACPVGMHAINPVPRMMIFEAVNQIAVSQQVSCELFITIEIPTGIILARKTFNPKLGIMGGISVLGTSGVVEPMSEQALVDTIRLEIHMQALAGRQRIVLTPGNYGEQFLKKEMKLSLQQSIKCSNFIYEACCSAVAEGITRLLLVGHIGKLIKVAGGVKNTHSKYGDRRMEILTQCVRQVGQIPDGLNEKIAVANTTDEALGYLQEAGILELVTAKIIQQITVVLRTWTQDRLDPEVVLFSNVYGVLGNQQLVIEQKERLWQEYCMEWE